MATDQFSSFVQASVGHLDNIIGGKFSSYSNDISAEKRRIEELVDLQKKEENIKRQAAIQAGIDMMQAANRAVVMREMTHRDYIGAYRASTNDRKSHLERRLKRFEARTL